MSHKSYILILSFIASLCITSLSHAQALVNDTIYNPTVVYTNKPKTYEIAGITVSGADNYEDYIIIGYSGLSVGQRV